MFGFWDFIIDYPRVGADGLGDYARLMKRGLVARPREVASLAELRIVLTRERVEYSSDRLAAIWKAYRLAVERRLASSAASKHPPSAVPTNK